MNNLRSTSSRTTNQSHKRGGQKNILLITLVMATTFSVIKTAQAQVAGSTNTIGVSVIESTRVALGWSVKKSILGKPVFNEVGEKIGKVEDLIISPDKSVSYLIVGAGGFLGMGRHDVAIPATQVQNNAGKLVVAGATKAIVQSMPRFEYADDMSLREQFMDSAKKDIATGKTKVAELEKKAAAAAKTVKANIDEQTAGLKRDLKTAEEKLAEMDRAAAHRWKEFEGAVNDATVRLRKSISALTV